MEVRESGVGNHDNATAAIVVSSPGSGSEKERDTHLSGEDGTFRATQVCVSDSQEEEEEDD